VAVFALVRATTEVLRDAVLLRRLSNADAQEALQAENGRQRTPLYGDEAGFLSSRQMFWLAAYAAEPIIEGVILTGDPHPTHAR